MCVTEVHRYAYLVSFFLLKFDTYECNFSYDCYLKQKRLSIEQKLFNTWCHHVFSFFVDRVTQSLVFYTNVYALPLGFFPLVSVNYYMSFHYPSDLKRPWMKMYLVSLCGCLFSSCSYILYVYNEVRVGSATCLS